MRKIKRVFPMYAIHDRSSIQKMLEKQAQKGWMPEALGNYLWKFKRTEPRKLHFAVTYFPEATFFDPEPSDAQRTLQEFCQHAGWELVGAYGPMQVFSNEADDPLPIETDPLVELKMIHEAVRKNYLPSYWMLLTVWVLNFGMQVTNLMKSSLETLGSNHGADGSGQRQAGEINENKNSKKVKIVGAFLPHMCYTGKSEKEVVKCTSHWQIFCGPQRWTRYTGRSISWERVRCFAA